MPKPEPRATRPTRRSGFLASRVVIVLSSVGALATLALRPRGPVTLALDALFRAYAMFLGAVMAHEGVHGHLGRTKRANFGWARWALVPTLVPFANFQKTHRLHHQHTNDPQRDPDVFVKPRGWWEIPVRALAMPHQWFFWLRARGLMRAGHVRDLAFNYLLIAAVHVPLAWLVGAGRYVAGVVPALLVVSLLLWYPFAIKTHEGWSEGPEEARSHDYHGRALYWFSLGLSVHRAHHMDQTLTWRDLRHHVREAPRRRALVLPSPLRDIRPG